MDPLLLGGVSAIGNLAAAALNQGYNEKNILEQEKSARRLMQTQWSLYQSPEAQVKSMTKAGLNPAVMLGEGKGTFASPSPAMPSSAPVQVSPLFDMSGISNYIASVANAKKAGMDTKLSEQEIKNKEIERQVQEFDLSVKKLFDKEVKSVEVANAYRNLLLAADTHDLNEQQKALNEYKKATEKAISDAKESEASILKQRLENNPTAIRLENQLMEEKAKTEKASQYASYASADASRQNARLNSALADIEERGKSDKIDYLLKKYRADGMLSEADYQEARLRAERLAGQYDKRVGSSLFKETDDFMEWIKDKVRIFK